ncbi:phosphodiester glycosidase family protein [Catenulispora pinisilvae]|uniref:phosphodiester glycosidase family protein n=1 Tax=Catenulispora pinisilvae TaxID=2705253 RepID=UPI002B275AAC|nr:phosphodiester glycosidase family protein [Catenulispora pinisilvae]
MASCAAVAAPAHSALPPAKAGNSGGASASWLPKTPDQWPLVVDESLSPKVTLTRGVQQYSDQLQTVGGAQRAQVMDVNLADPNVRLGVVESHDHLTDPVDEVPSSMAHRTGAVAGVNGDFFEIYGSGRPLGMVVIDGRLVKSPDPSWNADLWVRHDGTIGIGTETYTGTLTDGAASTAITSVNAVNSLSGNAIVRVTPDLGTPSPIPASTVVAGHLDGTTLVVDSVTAGVTSLPQLAKGTEDLVGSGAQAQWLSQSVHTGDRVAVSEKIGPDPDVVQGLSGGAILVQNGQRAVPLQGSGENNVDNPVTAVGTTKDGKHAVFAAFDGHQSEDVAQGLTRPQIAGWMMQHGAYNAILFDSGGSTQMVGRLPGQTQASVLNVPSDGHERPVANGLFIYSTEKAPAPAVRAVVNGDKPLTVLAGTKVPLSAYGLDAADNPARDGTALKISPPKTASVDGSTLTFSRPGHAILHATAGHAHSTIPVTVLPSLGDLLVSPSQVDLDSGATQLITASATAPDGSPVDLPASAVKWSVDQPSLGSVAADGTFTAAADGSGMVTVTASAGGRTAAVSIAVGRSTTGVDPLTDASKWSITDAYMNVYPRKVPSPGSHSTSDGSMTFDPATKAQPGDAGSFDIHYNYPDVSKTFDLSVYLNDPDSEQIPLLNGTQAPIGIGVWVKGNPDLASRPGAGLAPGIVTLNVGIWQSTAQPTSFYPTGVTFDGWQYVVAQLPPGLQYPLRINYLGLVVIKPGPNLSGDVHLADLQAVYSPRPPVPPTYTAIPKNPSWLSFTDVNSFKPGGSTIAAFDDAHTTAASPTNTGTVAMKAMPGLLANLPAAAKPSMVQALGDMADDGQLPDLTNLKTLFDGLGVPYHDAVGNHEITQGATPENGDFASVFGATHYAYDQGAARVIVTDSGHIGITASDPYQNVDTDESQYLWLAQQLTQNTQKVAIVTTHVPAYDPHPRDDSQFSDRFEAQMYERLVQKYQQTHPGVHVLMLYGHARGWAEDVRLPDGTESPNGIPNFVVADLGATPYAPVNQGGFYNYGLFNVLPDGRVQFAVQPLLTSVAVTAPTPALARGAKEQLAAVGTSLTGTDAQALQVPIADPVSRHWASSDPRVASVDPSTGVVTAHCPGSVTVSVTAGSVTGSASITVK